jgi:hypothetical protein
LEDSAGAAPIETAVGAESPSSNEDTEIAASVNAIAQDESATVQRRADVGTETAAPTTLGGLEPAGDGQSSPFSEVIPAIEAGARTESLSPTDSPEASTINRVTEALHASSAPPSSGTTPIADIPTTADDNPAINRAVETTDAPTISEPTDSLSETEAIPVSDIQPVSNDASISHAAKTTDVPIALTSGPEAAPVAEFQTGGDDTSTINRAVETIDAPISSPPEVEVVSPVAEFQTGDDDTSTINRAAKTADAPKASLSEAAQVADIQAFSDDASASSPAVEALDISPSAAQSAASSGPNLVQRRVTPGTQDKASETSSESISTPETPERVTPVEDIVATTPSPEISRAPADAPSAAQDLDLPKLAVFKPLSVIQPLRSPNPRMTVTNPDDLAVRPSDLSEPPKTVPPISPPEVSASSPLAPVIQRRTETATTSAVESNASEADAGETTSNDYSQQFPSMPSPDEVMAALAGLSSSQSSTVQRKPEGRSEEMSSLEQATAGEQSTSAHKSPQIRRKATAQAPPTEWSDVESLLNTSKTQQSSGSSGSTSPSPPTSASSDSYSNLKPFETIQRKAAQASSDTIQPDEAATIATSFDESGESGASPELLDQLVHQVYALICQRLAVERERYGLSRRR